jgi:tetratricopeptide (TPR) repeat protein
MASPDDRGEPPTPTEIRAALDRIVASSSIRTSPKLSAFLRFVVEQELAGVSANTKAYTIAVEALGRGPNFDPQTDPIVRVEAGRLRRAIAAYYAGPGADDPVVIDLPRGHYVPTFSRRSIARPERRSLSPPWSSIAAWAQSRPARASLALFLIAAAAMLAVLGVRYRLPELATTASIPTSSFDPSSAVALRPGAGLPRVFIRAFDETGGTASAGTLEDLRHKLRDALARFDEIVVASEPLPPARGAQPHSAPQREYDLAGTLRHNGNGTASLAFRLFDVADGTIAWTRSFDGIPVADLSAPVESEIVQQVAPLLAQPYGVIYARELNKLAVDNVDPRYRCLLGTVEYRRGFDRSKGAGMRSCLEQVTTRDPTFAVGFAVLALLNLREYYENDNEDGSAVLARATAAAQRAVDLKPHSARSRQALMSALFARGAIAEALVEGQHAVTSNPYDMTVLQAYGMRLVLSGQIEKGAALLRQAATAYPTRPAILEFSLFLSAYLLGDYNTATNEARLFTNDDYPLLLVCRAIAAARVGDRSEAQRTIDRLSALHPGWRENPRQRLRRYIPSAQIVERLALDLAAIGFGGTN